MRLIVCLILIVGILASFATAALADDVIIVSGSEDAVAEAVEALEDAGYDCGSVEDQGGGVYASVCSG